MFKAHVLAFCSSSDPSFHELSTPIKTLIIVVATSYSSGKRDPRTSGIMLFAIPVQLKAPFSALKQTSSYKWVTFEGVLAIP